MPVGGDLTWKALAGGITVEGLCLPRGTFPNLRWLKAKSKSRRGPTLLPIGLVLSPFRYDFVVVRAGTWHILEGASQWQRYFIVTLSRLWSAVFEEVVNLISPWAVRQRSTLRPEMGSYLSHKGLLSNLKGGETRSFSSARQVLVFPFLALDYIPRLVSP